MIALTRFNDLPADQALALLEPCVAIPGWSHVLVAARPFASRDDLLGYAGRLNASWGEKELMLALRAHPRIGEKPSGQQAHAALSRQEQAAVNHHNVSLQATLTEANRRYEDRFGRVFLIRAKGRSGEEILHALEQRLAQDEQAELRESLRQLSEITLLRLEGVIAE